MRLKGVSDWKKVSCVKRLIPALCCAIACSACGQERSTPAAAYQRWQDRLVAATHIPFFGFKPLCSTGWRSDKNVGSYDLLPLHQCYKFDAPQQMRGLWRNDFEGSRLCPAPASACFYGSPGDKIWFDYSFGLTDTRPRKWKVQPGGLYAVDFIGRATKYRGRYGHMGAFDRLVVVDRIIAMREVEAPPKPAEQDETLK